MIEVRINVCRNFSEDLWKRCVFVLTFTDFWLQNNDICDLNKDQKIAALNALKENVKDYANGSLIEETFDRIPFVLAGTIKQRQLIRNDDTEVINSNDAEQNVLAAAENWLVELWRVCYKQCDDDKKHLLDRFIITKMLGLVANTGSVVVVVGAGILGAVIMLKKVCQAATFSKKNDY